MNKKVIIIAEAGVNHNGNLDNAKKLILAAANAGADYVKFQTFKADKLASKDAQKAEYQKVNLKEIGDTQYEMLKKLEMPEDWHYQLINYANECGIKFLSTGFDEESIDFLDSLNIDLFKVPSGEITNKPYLEHIAKKGKPIILSTGMSTLEEVRDAISVLKDNGIPNNNLTVLHCNTEYPTPMEDVNLLAMNTIQNVLGLQVGYSDHTLGIEVPIAAVALGAVLIEKHLTLDRTMDGPDHLASLTPEELKLMVVSIRNIEFAISGSGIKEPSLSEQKNSLIARKSIHTNKLIKKGQTIKKEDLIMMRPGDGISPMLIESVIGSLTNKNLPQGYKISLTDLTKRI
jgi:N-acetylneuraminate synthase/N,N'-diacetyllegionaminate synthase